MYQGLFACDWCIDPLGLHTASLGFAAKVTKEKNSLCQWGRTPFISLEKVLGWDTNQKRLKATSLA